MATEQDDSDIPETGGVFTFGKSKFNDNVPGKFWIRNDAVVQVACGDEHTALLAQSGRIFTFGANDWGQLGIGSTKSSIKPSCVKSLKHEKARLVACGRSHTLIATESGKLYGFGANGENQLGIGSLQSTNDPVHIDSLEPQQWKMLAAGTGHSAALTEHGKLYMWGSGSEGQLGLGDEEEVVTPKEVTFDSKVVCVSCGYYHTAVVTAKGELYTFGENENGKLGIGDEVSQVEQPQLVSIPEKVVWTACGGGHTVAITAKGRVYTFGDGQQGQLGHGTILLQQATPKVVDKLKEVIAVSASCGENHTAITTDKGHLYTCGDGRHGKLGLGEENFANQFKPFRVTRFNKFVVDKTSCGGCHMLVLAHPKVENGEVESSGDEEAEDPLKATFANSLRGRDVIDLGGSISARDRRRQNDKKSPLAPLNRTLPPLTSNKQALPPLSSTLPAPDKENPLNKGRLPHITYDEKKSKKEESDEEEEDDEEDEGSEVSVTPEGESEEDEDTLNQTLRFRAKQKSKEKEKEGKGKKDKDPPKPVPRGRKKVQESEEEEEDEDEDEDESEEEKDTKKKEKQTDKSNNAKKNSKKVEESEEDEEEDEDDEEDDEEDEKDQKSKAKKKEKVVDSEDEDEEDEEDTKKKGKGKKDEKKAKPANKKKSGFSLFGKNKNMSAEDDEEEDDEEDEEEEKDKKKKGKKNKNDNKKKSKDEDEEDDEEDEEDEEDTKGKDKKKDKDKKKKKGKKDEEEEEDEDEEEDEEEKKDDKKKGKDDKKKDKKDEKEAPPKKSRTCTIL